MSAVSITTAATVIVAASTQSGGRIGLFILNNSTTTVYIGPDSTVTTANGFPLLAGEKFILQNDTPNPQYFYTGAVYGIVATGTADVRYWEMQWQ